MTQTSIYISRISSSQKDYNFYFREAISNISEGKYLFYDDLSSIKADHNACLIVNWPEEVLSWNVNDERVKSAISSLNQLKNDGLKIMYIWHNSRPHHTDNGKRALYEFIQSNASLTVHLNNHSLNWAKTRSLSAQKKLIRHPFMYNGFPEVQGDGLLIYGRLRHRKEILLAITTLFVCSVLRRHVYLGSFPKSTGHSLKLIFRLLKKNKFIHLNDGILKGQLEMEFWGNCKTVLSPRSGQQCNSGILINGISEKRRFIVGDIGSAADYNISNVVFRFKNILHLIYNLIMDTNLPYEKALFSTDEFVKIEKESSAQSFENGLRNALSILTDA